jgi:protein gp37
VSPACAHSYAEALNLLRGNGRPYLPGRHARPLLDDRVLEQPAHWRRPRRVFVCSMTDVAWDQVPDDWLARIWAVMARTPQHTYLVLTKRPARLADLLSSERFEREVRWYWDQAEDCPRDDLPWGDVFGHVWVGATVENQTWAERRLPHLLRVPAAVRFLSCEPLLGPLDLRPWLGVERELPDHYRLPAGPGQRAPGCDPASAASGG